MRGGPVRRPQKKFGQEIARQKKSRGEVMEEVRERTM